MGLWSKLVMTWNEFWGDPVLGGLTQDEYDEYEMLGEAMEWRRLRDGERERFDELNRKRNFR